MNRIFRDSSRGREGRGSRPRSPMWPGALQVTNLGEHIHVAEGTDGI